MVSMINNYIAVCISKDISTKTDVDLFGPFKKIYHGSKIGPMCC